MAEKRVAALEIYSNGFKVSGYSPLFYSALVEFANEYVLYKWEKNNRGRSYKVPKEVYAAATSDRREMRFHINELSEFFKRMTYHGFIEEHFNITYKKPVDGVPLTVKYIEAKTPRDYQQDLIAHILDPVDWEVYPSGYNARMVTLDTGGGKTFTALKAISVLDRRLIVQVLAKYTEKWKNDICEAFGISKGDLYVIQGRAQLISLMNIALAGDLKASVIIVSTETYKSYIKDYETKRRGESVFPIEPGDFYEKLDIGIRLIDECHQHLHFVYKMDVYANVKKSIYLSATIDGDDKFINRMAESVFPTKHRMAGRDKPKYIDVIAGSYHAEAPHKIRHRQRGMYNHNRFEESILGKRKYRDKYFSMIEDIIKLYYIDKKKEGQKALVFGSRVEFCTLVRDHLKKAFPTLSVGRYTGEDKYEDLMQNDLVVATLGKAGTAVDVKNLYMVLNTVSVTSKQNNLQSLGRLRQLVNYEGDKPLYFYLFCHDIEPQLRYHTKRMKDFGNSAGSFKTVHLPHRLE